MDIFQAAEEGNLVRIRQLHDEGANFNLVDEDQGLTPLMYAAAERQFEAVKLLIQFGARVNTPDLQQTPLMNAIFGIDSPHDNDEIIDYLLDNRATPDSAQDIIHGTSALLLAAKRAQTRSENDYLVKLLLEKGASIEKAETILNDRPADIAVSLREVITRVQRSMIEESEQRPATEASPQRENSNANDSLENTNSITPYTMFEIASNINKTPSI